MVHIAFLLAAMTSIAEPASPSRPEGASPPGVDCATQQTQAEMNACAARDLREAREQLAALLEELRRSLEPARWRALEEVQRTWQRFAEAHCRWEGAAFEGGSIRPMWESACLTALTIERLDRLGYQLCEGAGLSGTCEASSKYRRRPAESRER